MSIAVQTQQASQTAIAASIGSTWSCTPHLPAPDYRWYVHYEDFQKICKDKASDASALRGLETMTNNRIRDQRRFENIPVDALPNEDDLWIEISGYGLAEWNIDIYSDRTYNHSLVSLIDRGFLRRRFVAYPGRYMLEPVETTIYLDRLGNPFIIVDDDKQGCYVGDDGDLHSAADEGYTVMRRQYLYEIEAINTALAKLAGQSPPVSMPRWRSLQKMQRKSATEETTNPTLGYAQNNSSQTSAAQGLPHVDDEQGIKAGLLFANKNNTNNPELSLENSEKLMSIEKLSSNSVSLRSAPWSPETLIALAAHYLAIPDSNTVDEEQWRRDWLEPALWLIDFTKDLDCTRAWEIIERHVVGMLSGPTWYAQKRARKTSFTLRHVVGTDKNTAQFTGNTWHVVENELNTAQWYPDAHIEYAGPPLFDDCAESSYAQGYTAQPSPTAQPEEPTAQSTAQSMETAHYVESTAQVLGDDAQTEPVVEVVAGEECAVDQVSSAHCEEGAQSLEVEDAQCAMETEMAAQPEQSVQGMTLRRADTLMDMIAQERPEIHAERKPISPGLYLVYIETALDQWLYFDNIIDWAAPTPATQRAIDRAERYGKQRRATEGNDGYADSQGPPGYDEVSEGGDE